MMRRMYIKARIRLLVAGSVLLAFGGCGLSDTQVTSIAQSLITTALTGLLNAALGCLLPAASA